MTELSSEPVPGFCPSCGTSVGRAGELCARCSARASTPALSVAVEASETRARSSLRSALILYFSLLGVSAVLTIVTLAAGDNVSADWTVGAEIAATVGFAVVVLVACVPYARLLGPMLARIGNPAWTIAAPVIAVGTYLLASALLRGVDLLLSLPELRYSDPFEQAGYGLGLPILLIAVCPAVFEELAFRGVMQSALSRVLEAREATIVTALLFAIIHLSPLAFPHLLVMGLVLGYLRRKTGSLYPCMALHFSHNALCILVEQLPSS